MAGIAGRHSRQAGATVPPFFLRLMPVNHAEARRPRPSPNVSTSTHPGRISGPTRSASPGTYRGEQPAEKTVRLPKQLDAGPCAAEPRTANAGPRTANAGPAKTARGPWISGHRHRPKNRAARPNFRGPRRCGTSACAMFLANNYVKNGISSD